MRSISRERVRKISDNKPNPDSKKYISVTTPRRSVTLSLRLEHCFSLSSDCLQFQYSDNPVPGTRRTRCSEYLACMI